uniref:Ribosomal protein eL8/eL30/eS12/Gadd45 domain-containing protein n=1 Tax=Mola mola TaxID=94237 RepID=A0A3Q3W1K8_MOLML
MTLEELVRSSSTDKKMDAASRALEQLLVAAQRQDCVTMGVYESAKLMNVDPDSVVLCVLATDEEDEGDIALQIHFTLLQAFCCDYDVNILRVSGLRRLSRSAHRELHFHCVNSDCSDPNKDGRLPVLVTWCGQGEGRHSDEVQIRAELWRTDTDKGQLNIPRYANLTCCLFPECCRLNQRLRSSPLQNKPVLFFVSALTERMLRADWSVPIETGSPSR